MFCSGGVDGVYNGVFSGPRCGGRRRRLLLARAGTIVDAVGRSDGLIEQAGGEERALVAEARCRAQRPLSGEYG